MSIRWIKTRMQRNLLRSNAELKLPKPFLMASEQTMIASRPAFTIFGAPIRSPITHNTAHLLPGIHHCAYNHGDCERNVPTNLKDFTRAHLFRHLEHSVF